MCPRLRWFPILLLACASPLFAALPEVPVSAPVYGGAPGNQSDAMIASNGDQFLAVWPDGRDRHAQVSYAARIDADGTLLDPTGIRIPMPNLFGVLWTGDSYVVLDRIQNITAGESTWSVAAMRIDAAGRIVDGPRDVFGHPLTDYPSAAATNGANIVVPYGDRVAVLDAHANVVRQDVPLPDLVPHAFVTGIASNGSGYLITWEGHSGLLTLLGLITLDSSANVRASFQLGTSVLVAVASDGDAYLLLTRDPATYQLSARRITDKAEAFDAPQVLAGIDGTSSALVVWTGTEYVVAPASGFGTDAAGMRLDSTGHFLGATPIALRRTGQVNVAAATNDGRLAVLSHASGSADTNETDLYATLIDSNSWTEGDAMLVSRSAVEQTGVSVAASDRNLLVVWQEASGIRARRVSFDGRPLDPEPALISTGTNPRVVFNGFVYLLTSVENQAIRIRRIAPDGGAPTDGGTVPMGQCGGSYDVASGGSGTLLAWTDCRMRTLEAVRIDAAGMPDGSPVALSPPTMTTANPSIGWNGTEYLVAFEEMIAIPWIILAPVSPGRPNVRAVRLTPGMTLLDSQPIAVAVTDQESNGSPRVASNGSDFLIAWTNGWPAEGRALRIDNDGNALDSEPMRLAGGSISSVLWDGSRYAIAYSTDDGDALLTHFAQNDRVVISATSDFESTPMLVRAGSNIVAAYLRTATENVYGGVSRAFLREPGTPRMRAIRAR